MFNFAKKGVEVHAANVHHSFIHSINSQYQLCSDNTLSDGTYLFSIHRNPNSGWVVKNVNNAVTVKTDNYNLRDLNSIVELSEDFHKRISVYCRNRQATDEDKKLLEVEFKTALSQKYKVDEAEFKVSVIPDSYTTSNLFISIDITNPTNEKIVLISNLLSVSQFKPLPEKIISMSL